MSLVHLIGIAQYNQLLGEAFAVGLVMDGLEEVAFPKENTLASEGIGWSQLWQIPAVLTCRLRVRLLISLIACWL